MRIRGLLFACFLGSTLLTATAARAEVELKNDGFVDGEPVGFQSGFVEGEIGASRFTPPVVGVALLKVQLLFGGGVDGAKRDVILHVWDDAALTDDPGTELFVSKYALTAADTALQELVIGDPPLLVQGPFRVGIELTAADVPSIARDSDGTIGADTNFIFVKGEGWKRAADLGVSGDWVIRAFVEGGEGGGGAGGGAGTGGAGGGGGGTTTGAGGGGATGTGGSATCTGADCPPTTASDSCSCEAAGSAPDHAGAFFAGLALASAFTARRRTRAR